MSETKFCIDCKWCDVAARRCLHALAANPKGSDAYANWLVTGTGERPDPGTHYLCVVMRKCDCGTEGRLWEPLPIKAAA